MRDDVTARFTLCYHEICLLGALSLIVVIGGYLTIVSTLAKFTVIQAMTFVKRSPSTQYTCTR
jgi:hypothetical protein